MSNQSDDEKRKTEQYKQSLEESLRHSDDSTGRANYGLGGYRRILKNNLEELRRKEEERKKS